MRHQAKLGIFIIGALVLTGYLWLHCPKQIHRRIGSFKTFEAGAAASILEVSRILKQCASSAEISVTWYYDLTLTTTTGPKTGQPLIKTIYTRTNGAGTICNEADVGSGCGQRWTTTDEEIHRVAAAHGTFDDFTNPAFLK